MSKENIRQKSRSRKSIMRQVRLQQVKNKRMDSSSSVNIDDVDDLLDINLIIHMKSLISLMKQTLCCECKHLWNSPLSVKTRNGLYKHV